MKKTILLVFGTRPEIIKMAPVLKALAKENSQLLPVSCFTGQHKTMAEMMLDVFNIDPMYRLEVMENNQSLSDVTTKVIKNMNTILQDAKPDMVLVQGDTTTTFCAALASFYNKIPVGHIEAGLRSKIRYEPFPEEINRCLTSHIATLHFAPTSKSRQNLLNEGISDKSIFITGNTVIDALFSLRDSARDKEFSELKCIDFKKRIILATVHRRESFGKPLENICKAFKEILSRYPDVAIVYPVHLNPNVKKIVNNELMGVDRVYILDPINYEAFVQLMEKSYLILSDSGGIQEEAPSLNKPVLILRDVSERPEVLEVGAAKLVGSNTENIVKEVSLLLDNTVVYKKMASAVNPFGNGNSGELIVETIHSYFSKNGDK